jgi:hypothetical protein
MTHHLNPAIQYHFLDIAIAQGKGVVEPDTVAHNFAGESMTVAYGSAIVNRVEPVRLFYLWVKLTYPDGVSFSIQTCNCLRINTM